MQKFSLPRRVTPLLILILVATLLAACGVPDLARFRAFRPSPTPRPTPTLLAAPTRPPAPAPSNGVRTVVIRAADIENGTAAIPGLTVTGLKVTMTAGVLSLRAASLSYTVLKLDNISISGHFTLTDGVATFVADEINPRNLATSLLPTVINQTLQQQLSQWYVENLTVEAGQLTATVRPR